jgi:hypothetical protein
MSQLLEAILRENFRCGRMLNSWAMDMSGHFAVPRDRG